MKKKINQFIYTVDLVITFSEYICMKHDKTNKMTGAPREDSEQHGHPPRLIRVFTVCSMGS